MEKLSTGKTSSGENEEMNLEGVIQHENRLRHRITNLTLLVKIKFLCFETKYEKVLVSVQIKKSENFTEVLHGA